MKPEQIELLRLISEAWNLVPELTFGQFWNNVLGGNGPHEIKAVSNLTLDNLLIKFIKEHNHGS